VLGKLYRVFLRYSDRHMSLERPGCSLKDGEGREFGRIERLALRQNRLVVEGWADAERLGLIVNRTRQWTVPDLARPGTDWKGFTLDIPFEPGALVVQADREGGPVRQGIAGFTATHVKLARARLLGPFLLTLLRLLPEIYRWKRQGDMGARELVKEGLGLVPGSDAAEMDGALLVAPPARGTPAPRQPFSCATIILPVYNAFDVLPEALERVARHSGKDWRLILVEDCSPDPAVRPFVEDWSADPERAGRVTLLRNETNLGFIGSVNRALEAARRWPDDPVVLLNSDALVPQGWLERLLAPMADPEVASVTPMSNDAEIFTAPVICRPTALAEGEADALDAVGARFQPQAALVEAPTGVGFCMAMAPRFLRQLPALDTGFGRGYGEETDWCQKARQLGGRHLCAANLFVEHRGGQSFGSASKQQLLERNAAEISRRYPSYDQEVQDFIRNDPLNTARLALGLSWAALHQQAPVPVYLAHAMGGGAEKYLQGRIAQDIAAGGSAVVLRVGQGHRWKLELHTAHGVSQGLTNDTALIEALIGHLPRRRIVYSCGVGDRDALTLPDILLGLAGQSGAPAAAGCHPVEVLFHDFFPISPSYTLLGKDGVYRGVPRPGSALAPDPAHSYPRPGGDVADLAEWQSAWGRLIAAAERIVTFSDDSRRQVAEAYPAAQDTLTVIPHPLLQEVPRVVSGWDGSGPPCIGVLGNIGYQKGASVLQRLSRDLARSGRARLVVIGQIDPAYPLAAPAQVHGSYELRDLPGLVARYGIAAWLMPSIWPETFSFTTHEALATGLPVFSFDLGAQRDAVARALAQGAPGGVLPLQEGNLIDSETLVAAITSACAELAAARRS
jgi:GT2 family glycosyltransferase/glycosyltransferase involved in cell wall biosynthesis